MAKLDIVLKDATLESVYDTDFELTSKLMAIWTDRAKDEESAVRAMVVLMNERQEIIKAYRDIKPDEESSVERFIKQREERRKKTTRKIK